MVERILARERALLAVLLLASLVTVILPRVADGTVVAVVSGVGLFVAAATAVALAAATVIAGRRRS